LREWLTQNFPFIDNPFNWNEFITQLGPDLRQWLTEIFPHIDSPVTWNEFITNLGPELTEWITNNFQTITGDTWEEFITNFGDELGDWIENNYPLTEVIEQKITEIINQYFGEDNSTRLISGSVIWLQNLDFKVTPLVYQILGQRVESAGGNITIPTNAGENPMFAVIYADVNGQIGYILGEPAANPAIPHVNDNTQIALTPVYIPALSNEPGEDPGGGTGTIETTVIYDENVEWQTAKVEDASVAINLEAATDPASNAKHIQMDIAAAVNSAWSLTGTDIENDVIFQETYDAPFTNFVWEMWPNFRESANDRITGQTRRVIFHYFREIPKTVVTRCKINGVWERYIFNVTNVTYQNFAIAELGINIQVPQTMTLESVQGEVPAGIHTIYPKVLNRQQNTYEQAEGNADTGIFTPQTTEVSFTAAQAVAITDGVLSMYLKMSVPWLSSTGLKLELLNGNTLVGSLNLFRENGFGFDADYNQYQLITLPVSAFNPTGEEITKLVVRPLGEWPNNSTLKIDLVTLQTGIELPDDPEVDKFVESASFNAGTKILTLNRTAGLPPLLIPIPYPDSSDGLSAYEIAVNNGFVGTEQQWLDSLVGEQGPQGIQGIQGIPGEPGQDASPLDWIEFEFRDVTPGTAQEYVLDLKATAAYIINSGVFQVDDGSLTVTVKNGSNSVIGLSNRSAMTTAISYDASGSNSIAVGAKVVLSISATYSGNPTLIRGKLNLTRS
jgi:hypothetical protein